MADGAPDPGRGGDDAGFEAAVQGLEQAFSRLVLQHRQVMVRYAAALSPALSVGAMKAFMMLANEGTMTPSAVAEGLLVDRAQVSRMVRDLEAAGLITREPDPRDRRSALLSASPEGLARP
ncbi:MarR family transcriptional regulator, partial [Micrococcus sp. HSID17228]|uniref:MarR family winged helix-turn-helix transcriptional regulator n=1 Tax=Micrococcus sp. HSID17228 TaxID=2419507 RepID=UPI000FA5A83E